MKINVLGTEYDLLNDETNLLITENADGICKPYEKTIIIRKTNGFLDNDSTPAAKEARKKEVIRHELIHAFFNESGLNEYYENEQLTNWLAIQFPKLQKAFEEAGCL